MLIPLLIVWSCSTIFCCFVHFIIIQPVLELLCGALVTVRGRPVIDGGEQLVKAKKSSSSQSALPTHNIKMAWLLQVHTG